MSSPHPAAESGHRVGRASDDSATTRRFLQATASEQWVPLPELVAGLTQAGYWELVGPLTADQQAAHVREQLATLRDGEGHPLFERLDVRLDSTTMTVYKQVRPATRPVATPEQPRAAPAAEGRGLGGSEAQAVRMYEVLQALLAIPATDLSTALNAATQRIAESLGADKVDALLFDPATDSLVALGTSDTPMGRQQHALGLNRLPVAQDGRAVMTFQSGIPFRDNHVDQDPYELDGIKHALGVRSHLLAPLVVGEERRGVLLACSAQPNAFADSDLPGFVAIAHWVGTVAQKAELAEAMAAQQRQVEAERLRRQLLAGVSHELLTPVAIIKGHADTLHSRAIRHHDDLAEAALLAINDEVDRLQRIIANLLDAARVGSGQLEVTLVPVDLHAIITRGVQRFQGRTARHQLVFDVPDALPAVLGDREYLTSVLYNLLTNAIKYAPRGGTITVRAQVQDAMVACVVADEGRGIAPEQLARIFEPYYRVPQSGAQADGLGLGLYISRAIIEAHDGRMWAESQLGQGTQIHFTVPAASEALLEDELV